jgi:hypothetical protein
MAWLTVVLRLLHVVLGAAWFGMMLFNVAYLMPALADAGPAGGAVMASLQRRKFMIVMPIIALVTILSGYALLEIRWGGWGGAFGSSSGRVLAVGAVLAIVAFLIGVILVRPLMTRAGQVAQGMASARSDQERADRVTELEQLRARGAGLSRLVMALLLLTTVAMAVARYV